MIRLILDVTCMRVTYFTANLKEKLTLNDGLLMYDYYFAKPADMTLDNCWTWKLIGNTLVYSNDYPAPPPPATLVEQNRKETLKLLDKRINEFRAPLLSSCIGGDIIRSFKVTDVEFINLLAQANDMSVEEYTQLVNNKKTEYESKLKITEVNREYYTKLLKSTETSEQIVALRDELANVDLTILQSVK
jgi:hypothetical protein